MRNHKEIMNVLEQSKLKLYTDNEREETDKKVEEIIKGVNMTKKFAPFHVRKSWNKPDSEIGTYTSLKVASSICDSNPEFTLYDKYGKVIYSPSRGIDIRKKLVSKT